MERVAVWIESGTTESDYQVVETLIHPDAEVAMRFWRQRPSDGLRIGRDVPSRAVARLLSRVGVCEPSADGCDFRVHLAGELTRRRFERDVTGELMSELFAGADFQPRFTTTREAIDRNEPRMVRIVHRAGRVDILRIEVLVLPVMAPNGKDRWALVFGFYF